MSEFWYWRFIRPAEKLKLWFVWKMPRWLVYWCAVRLTTHATTGPYSNQIVPELRVMDALDRWEKRAKVPPALLRLRACPRRRHQGRSRWLIRTGG